MLEIGNQYVRAELGSPYRTGKEYWSSMGVLHTSMDWNGLDGALPVNLEKPLYGWDCAFDVVTDIGTSCCMSNRAQCHANLVAVCAIDGVIISVVPEVGSQWSTRWKATVGTAASMAGGRCEILDNVVLPGLYGPLRAIALRKWSHEGVA